MASTHHGSSNPHEAPAPSPPQSGTESVEKKHGTKATWQTLYHLLSYTPRRCRYDPANPPKFSIALNLLFAFAASFTVANLYYSHPILHLLAQDFNVSNERASLIPTLAQAGYAAGLLFLCPLGDIFPRRHFVLALVFCTATVWYVWKPSSVASDADRSLPGSAYASPTLLPYSAPSPSSPL